MTVLAIDTAGPVIGVALLAGGAVAVRTERVERGSETRLVPWAEALCAQAGLTLKDVGAIAVSVGPGAFTGLRVGLATATGLALALGVPVVTATSLETRARRAGGGRVLSMLDARKGRVYAQLWEDGAAVRGPADVAPEDAVAWVTAPFVATGEGALAYRALVEARGGRVAAGADDPAADVLAALGEERIGQGLGLDPVDVRPLYLREADAVPSRA